MSQTEEVQTFSAKSECIGVNHKINFGYKIQIQIFNYQIFPGFNQPVNWVASTTEMYQS